MVAVISAVRHWTNTSLKSCTSLKSSLCSVTHIYSWCCGKALACNSFVHHSIVRCAGDDPCRFRWIFLRWRSGSSSSWTVVVAEFTTTVCESLPRDTPPKYMWSCVSVCTCFPAAWYPEMFVKHAVNHLGTTTVLTRLVQSWNAGLVKPLPTRTAPLWRAEIQPSKCSIIRYSTTRH